MYPLLDTKEDHNSRFIRFYNLQGIFPDEVTQQLKQLLEPVKSITLMLLEQNFSKTLHQDFLDAVGLDVTIQPAGTTEKKEEVAPGRWPGCRGKWFALLTIFLIWAPSP